MAIRIMDDLMVGLPLEGEGLPARLGIDPTTPDVNDPDLAFAQMQTLELRRKREDRLYTDKEEWRIGGLARFVLEACANDNEPAVLRGLDEEARDQAQRLLRYEATYWKKPPKAPRRKSSYEPAEGIRIIGAVGSWPYKPKISTWPQDLERIQAAKKKEKTKK